MAFYLLLILERTKGYSRDLWRWGWRSNLEFESGRIRRQFWFCCTSSFVRTGMKMTFDVDISLNEPHLFHFSGQLYVAARWSDLHKPSMFHWKFEYLGRI